MQTRTRVRGFLIAGLVALFTVLGSASVGAQQGGTISNTSGEGVRDQTKRRRGEPSTPVAGAGAGSTT